MLADILRYWARWQPDDVALRFEGQTPHGASRIGALTDWRLG